jgi:hypothetical protein
VERIVSFVRRSVIAVYEPGVSTAGTMIAAVALVGLVISVAKPRTQGAGDEVWRKSTVKLTTRMATLRAPEALLS